MTGERIQPDGCSGRTIFRHSPSADIEALLELGLTDVIDLRSEFEAEAEGPGTADPRRREVRIQQLSLFREWRRASARQGRRTARR